MSTGRIMLIPGHLRDEVTSIGTADILVGIPSYNNVRTIGHVVRAAQAGLAKYFPHLKSVLVNSDGGSGDGTQEAVREAAIDDFSSILLSHRGSTPFKILTPYHGIPGKGSAFRTIFQIAEALAVKACVLVDSDLRSITPEWIELLVKPVLHGGFDYVAPLYQRHKYDGTITNSIVYPLTRALYGKRIRQPIGGDFGVSGSLVRFYLTKNVWETDVARYGIDIWMTTTALANRFKVCQSYLGAKIHDPKDPGADLSAMLTQVVGATFDLMEEYQGAWKGISGSEPVPTFGFRYEVGLEPVYVNVDRMIGKFVIGVKELEPLWRIFMSEELYARLLHLCGTGRGAFHFSDEEWAAAIFSFAVAMHTRTLHRDHLLKSLTPLYLGRTASFVMETRDSTSTEVEEKIENLCMTFEGMKHALRDRW